MSARFALVVSLVLTFACGPTEPPADPNGELHMLGGEPFPQHLDPQQASNTSEVGQVSLLFDTLLTYDRTGLVLVPGLAEAFPSISADGLTYTLRLREGLRYSDGRRLVAADFAFAYRHLCDPLTRSAYSSAAVVVAGCGPYSADDPSRTPQAQIARDRDAVGVTAVDDRTIAYRLASRATYFPHVLATWLTAPTREDVVSRGDLWTEAGTLVGNGYFTLASWTHLREMVFERNELHVPKARLKRIVMSLATTASGALAAYRGGDVDVLRVGADQKAEVESDPVLSKQAIASDTACTTYVAFNVRRAPFDDPRVRLAFAKSFDRQTWSRERLSGLAAPIASFIPAGIPGHDGADNTQAFDPQAAAELLAGSRYAGSVPPVTFTYTGSPTSARIYQSVLDDWRRILGVDVQLAPADPTTLRDVLVRPETLPQLTLQGWCAAYPDPQDFLSLVFVTGSTVGRTNYSSPAFDELIRRADGETDATKRVELYRQAQRILTKDAPAVFVSTTRALTLVSPRVHGQSHAPLERVFGQFALADLYVSPREATSP